MSKFCMKCGKPMEDNARICPTCGAFVRNPTDPTHSAPPAANKPTQARGWSFRPKAPAFMTVGACILILVGIIVLVYACA